VSIGIRRVPGLDKARTVSFDMPARGLNLQVPGLFLDKQFTPAATNVRFYQGEVLNRPGIVTQGGVLDNVPLAGHLHLLPDRTLYTLLATKTTLYYWNTTTLAWTDVTTGTPWTGTDNDPWSFTTYDDDVYMSNGVDKIYTWNDPSGPDVAVVAASEPARYLITYAGRILAAHTTESSVVHADRLRWSAHLDPTVWDSVANPSAGFTETFDWPGPITGLSALAPHAFIHKRDAIIRVTETGLLTPAFAFQKVSEIGAAEGRTIAQIRGHAFFMGTDDVYIFNGSDVEPIGEPIRKELYAVLNREHIRKAFAFLIPEVNEYWLCVPTGGNTWPNTVYRYNWAEKTWARDSFEATAHTSLQSGSNEVIIIDRGANPIPPEDLDDVFDTIDDWITPIDSGLSGADIFIPVIGRSNLQPYTVSDTVITDDGAAVPVVFESADDDFGSSDMYKTINQVELILRDRGAASFTAQVSTDAGITWSSIGTKSGPGVGNNAVYSLRFPCRVNGGIHRMKIETSDVFALIRIVFRVQDRGEVK
jgi:hypothetical protein